MQHPYSVACNCNVCACYTMYPNAFGLDALGNVYPIPVMPANPTISYNRLDSAAVMRAVNAQPMSFGFNAEPNYEPDTSLRAAWESVTGPIEEAPDFVTGRNFYQVKQLGVDWDPDNDNEKGYREQVSYYNANLVGSATDLEEDGHLPCIDLDLPCHLEPSTNPEHYHLYINKVISWDKYVNLLNALRDAGLVSEKYVDMSVKRGQTFVRRPGVYKKPGEGGSS